MTNIMAIVENIFVGLIGKRFEQSLVRIRATGKTMFAQATREYFEGGREGVEEVAQEYQQQIMFGDEPLPIPETTLATGLNRSLKRVRAHKVR